MKYIDEYREPDLARGLIKTIDRQAAQLSGPVTFMEVCGSHTYAIGHFGIRDLLPENIRLISGPGCPVCVTAVPDVDAALYLAQCPDVIFTTFGDMLRVPGSDSLSLQTLRARGADIRVVTSCMDALTLARNNPDRKVVFMGIGFETTSPTVAVTVRAAERAGIKNFSVLSVHKTMPPALRVLIDDPELNVHGFLCPGHVSTITGAEAYTMLPEAGCAAVITGFEPVDILEGVYQLLDQILNRRFVVENQYHRGVKMTGNAKARELLDEVFTPADATWRGLGLIPQSGLAFRDRFARFDAAKRFDIPQSTGTDTPGCRCGDILRGLITPHQCPLFSKACTPLNPVGPCMVSTEGTCAAYYKFHRT